MDGSFKLSPSNLDFSVLEALFSPTSLITIFSGDGILLAANQSALTSTQLGPEAFGKHADELFEGVKFERTSRPAFEELLRTGVPNIVDDRVYQDKPRIIVRIRAMLLRLPWGDGFAVLNVSNEVPDHLVESLRNYNPKTKMFPSAVPGLSMRWADFETAYLVMRCSSTNEIATVLRRSDDAVRLRLQALADYLQRAFALKGYTLTVPPTLKDMQPFLRHWPINDVILAGCINGLNARYGDNTVAIAGFDARRKEEYTGLLKKYENPIESLVAEKMWALVKEINNKPKK